MLWENLVSVCCHSVSMLVLGLYCFFRGQRRGWRFVGPALAFPGKLAGPLAACGLASASRCVATETRPHQWLALKVCVLMFCGRVAAAMQLDALANPQAARGPAGFPLKREGEPYKSPAPALTPKNNNTNLRTSILTLWQHTLTRFSHNIYNWRFFSFRN